MNYSPTRQACEAVFQERRKFIVIGLTGRTGSGCSTTAELLSKSNFEEFFAPDPHSSSTFESDKHRKYNICFNYLKKNWESFYHIKLSNIISNFILEESLENFKNYLIKEIDINFKLSENFDNEFKKYKNELEKINQEKEELQKNNLFLNFNFNEIDLFTKLLKDELKDYQSKIFQAIGNNVRNSAKPYDSRFDPNSLYAIPQRANEIIKCLRNNKSPNIENRVFVCLDAIRNPFEASFFRERYSAFYLLSISSEENNRKNRLRKNQKYNDEQIKALDNKECPDKLKGTDYFTSLSVNRCIELADIHINNPQDNGALSELKKQLVKYLSLIMHPGLVPPSKSERCMQVAHDARLNSGCISRQVGAAIANTDYSIMALGWNTTPEGQTPCSLRDARDLMKHSDGLAFSDYEKKEEKFRGRVFEIYKPLANNNSGNPICFCFKDVHNSLKGDKNQVHTRALHAEENAFLQISKRGVEKIKGGILFTTASPCELCSKKAYQLGISKIYYIDPYPGIAESQILKSGTNRPNLIIFTGAIGRAYQQIYQPILPYKDKMDLYFDIKIPPKDEEIEMMELKKKIKEQQEEIEKLKSRYPVQ